MNKIPITSKRQTDLEMGKHTLKVRTEVINALGVIVKNPNYKSIYHWKSYSDLIMSLIEVFESMEYVFLREYINNLSKCNTCEYLNSNDCKNDCNVRKIFEKLEECQKYGRNIFK